MQNYDFLILMDYREIYVALLKSKITSGSNQLLK